MSLLSLFQEALQSGSVIAGVPRRRKQNLRARSRLMVGKGDSTAGLRPIVVTGARRKNLVHVRPQVVTAPVFNSGGFGPITTTARQKPSPKRSASRIVVAQAAIVAGTAPSRTAGLRRLNKARPASRIVVPPTFTATPGTRATLVAPVSRRKANLRPRSRIVPAPDIGAVASTLSLVIRAIQQGRQRRAASRIQIPRTAGAAIGPLPTVTRATQKGRQLRSATRVIVAVASAVAGSKPVVFLGIPRRKANLRPRSRFFTPITAAPPAGARPTIVIGSQKGRQLRSHSRWITRIAGAAAGTAPRRISAIVRRKPNLRPRSRIIRPLTAGGLIQGTRPVTVRSARRWAIAAWFPPQIIYGAAPELVATLVSGIRRRAAKRVQSRTIVAAASGPVQSVMARIVKGQIRRPALYPRQSIVQPGLGSAAGTPAVVTQGVRRKAKQRLEPQLVFTQVFAPTSILATILGGARRRNQTRSRSRIQIGQPSPVAVAPIVTKGRRRGIALQLLPTIVYGAAQELAGLITAGVRRKPAQRPRSHFVTPISAGAPIGTRPTVTVGIKRNNYGRPHSQLRVSGTFNSGGQSPLVVTRGRKWPRPTGFTSSRIHFAFAGIGAGILPRVHKGIRRGISRNLHLSRTVFSAISAAPIRGRASASVSEFYRTTGTVTPITDATSSAALASDSAASATPGTDGTATTGGASANTSIEE